eukprot:13306538-Alexandrium_andersonii.AAC.1
MLVHVAFSFNLAPWGLDPAGAAPGPAQLRRAAPVLECLQDGNAPPPGIPVRAIGHARREH